MRGSIRLHGVGTILPLIISLEIRMLHTSIGLFFDMLSRLGGRDPCHVLGDARGFEYGQHVLLDISIAVKLTIKHSVSRLCNCTKCQDRAWVSSHRVRPGGSAVTRPFSPRSSLC
jgi:hypothetical protein